MPRDSAPTRPERHWYKDAVIYELHVRSFYDSKGDGVGDFRGLAQKLDYLQDLGVTALWLLPFYPSPLKDDGYDTANYTAVHPSYGDLNDVRAFLKEAHRRSLRVVTEMVLNHTSDQHPWFQRARRAARGSPARDFYVWSDTPERYREARIIFKDFESSNWSWDPVAKAYYWHRFYSHQPDLNFDNPRVREAMIKAVDFWMGRMGVDGLRLDAVPYLYEREGTNCENLPETHAFLRELRRHVDERYPDRMLLAEANQWPEDAVAYFGGGTGDECHTAFHFPLMPRMFVGLQTEDRFPIVDMLEQTPPIPETSQWVLFLRNHDELTLEMVSDEERDYMYRAYAQDPQARINLGIRRRLAPLLGNSRRKIELMTALLLSLPGTPVIYYGDELGMGDNFYLGDRNGVRTPMQWSPDRNAGFSRANSQRLFLPVISDPEYHYEAINVDVQQNNPQSLLWWTKRVLDLRKRHHAFGRGTMEMLLPENRKVLVFLRRYGDESLLVVANLSRFAQHVELNLSSHRGQVPLEMFGQAPFPAIGEGLYPLSLGPHSFYWFALRPPTSAVAAAGGAAVRELPTLRVSDARTLGRDDASRAAIEGVLPQWLHTRPWFLGQGRRIQSLEVVDALPVSAEGIMVLVRVDYREGEAETYALPMASAVGPRAEDLLREHRHIVIARLETADAAGILYDALWDRAFCEGLLGVVARQRTVKGLVGEVRGSSGSSVRHTRRPEKGLVPVATDGEGGFTRVVYGDRFTLKLIRRLEEGPHPDLEMSRFLTERASFPAALPVLGEIEYVSGRRPGMTLAVLRHAAGPGRNARQHALDHLGRFFESVLAQAAAPPPPPAPGEGPVDLASRGLPPVAYERIGSFLRDAELLGQRTAEMHKALAADRDDPAFAPEPFSTLYQRALLQSRRVLTRESVQLLRRRMRELGDPARSEAQRLLALEAEITRRFRAVFQRKVRAERIRSHGDYRLEKLLYTGKDFLVRDFEGDAARPLSERRLKRSPLRDVAAMIRSLHHAADRALSGRVGAAGVRPEDLPVLEPWARFWKTWTSAAFLKSYLDSAAGAAFHPGSRDELAALLDAALIETLLSELRHDLTLRPERARGPLRDLLAALERGDTAARQSGS
jgi:maltose alpha-D-glucosyltransferase / alpha-amylase